MRKLFLHTPVFRFLSPVFSGIIAYLLILLVNNNIGQLQEQFLGQELYVCIGLSFIIHEFSRFLLWLFKKNLNVLNFVILLIVKIVSAVLLSGILIGALITSYYLYQSGYYPLIEELKVFVGIYCFIPLGYILLDMSHEYLYKVNTQKLENELLIKENIEEDFKQFKREINPDLLFESFEALIVLIHDDKDFVDDFIDNLAIIYRYILASKKNQLTNIKEELLILDELIKLYNYLPHRKINITKKGKSDFLLVPGTLLFVVEQIIKTSIVSSRVHLSLQLDFNDTNFSISYHKEDKITSAFNTTTIEDVCKVYSIYSSERVAIIEDDIERKITFPTLNIKS